MIIYTNLLKKLEKKYFSDEFRNNYLKDPDIFIKDPKFRDHIYSGKDFIKYLKIPFYEKFIEKNIQLLY